MRVRTIVTQDAEIDGRNSLRHFLFYANEVDLEKDVLKIAVIERHKGTHHIGIGYIQGYGLKGGAVALLCASLLVFFAGGRRAAREEARSVG